MRSGGTMGLWGVALLALFGCSGGTAPAAASGEAPKVTQRLVDGLWAKEPGSPPADYAAAVPTYRLLGVQPGDGEHGFATLMDTRTFATVNVPVGGLLSRSVALRSLSDREARFESSVEGPRAVPVGGELTAVQVTHRFDHTAEYLGRNRYQVAPATASDVYRRHGVGVAAEPLKLFGEPALRLTRVDAEGLFGRLGFQAGDILLTPRSLEALTQALLSPPNGGVPVRVSRGGNVAERRYLAAP